MKHSMIKAVSLFLAIILTVAVFSACGVDPNVKQEDKATADYKVKIDEEEEETEREGFYAYGKGKTDPVEVGGVEVNVKDFAVRSYELAFMMAQKSFDSPKNLPLDAAVQYAFIHIYFNDFYTINNKTVQYRSAEEQQIRDSLKEQFGTDDFDVTSSMLYNAGKKIFEMWVPSYGTNIYYIVDAVNVSGDKAEIVTTFYNELARNTLLGKATITVKIQDKKPVIESLKAEKGYMDDNKKALASENARLREALKKIAQHQAEIQKILDGVSDLLAEDEQTESAPVTEKDVKELLKKYSRLN